MFYEIVWEQIDMNKNKFHSILDFGSGFCITANHFASKSKVTAIDPNSKMLENAVREYDYTQICGGTEVLKNFPSKSFDLIICHNVLEYHDNPLSLIKEFNRLLSDDGIISLVAHSEVGKVMQTAVFQNDPLKAYKLLMGTEKANSKMFSDLKVYKHDELLDMISMSEFKINKTYGIRTFFALIQNNDIKFDSTFHKDMLKLELSVSDMEPYKSISFLKHYILTKKK